MPTVSFGGEELLFSYVYYISKPLFYFSSFIFYFKLYFFYVFKNILLFKLFFFSVSFFEFSFGVVFVCFSSS